MLVRSRIRRLELPFAVFAHTLSPHKRMRELGPYGFDPFFFARCDDVTTLMNRSFAEASELRVRGLANHLHRSMERRRVFTYANPAGDFVVWSKGPERHLESILPEKLIAATAAGEAVVVLLDKPEFDQPPSRSRFDVVWNELMPNPIIPFDRDGVGDLRQRMSDSNSISQNGLA